jgi:hypothetical protein
LNDPEMLASSGLRWIAPEDTALATGFICAINSSIATLPRPRWINLLWGGSMALRRSTLMAFQMEAQWQNVISDDLRLSEIIRASKGAILGPRRLLVRSPASFTWATAVEFAKRQYTLLRIHAPLHWSIAAAATTIPLIGWITATWLIILDATTATIALIFAASLLHQVRAALRRRIAALLGIELGMLVCLIDVFLAPALVLFHAVIIWSTLFSCSIKWGDRIYQLKRNIRC